jgi:hypothetical protein
MIPLLLSLANITENPATFEITAGANERLHLTFISISAGANAINSASLTVPGRPAMTLPPFGNAPTDWPTESLINNKSPAIPTPISALGHLWPVDLILEPGETLAFSYDVATVPIPPFAIAAAAYGWTLAPSEKPFPHAQTKLPTIPNVGYYSSLYTLPPGAPAPPPAAGRAIPPGGPIQLTWDVLDPNSRTTQLRGHTPRYPTSFGEAEIATPADPSVLKVEPNLRRTIAHLFGQGLNKARAIRASLTGRLHAGPYFIQSESGEYLTAAGATTIITPSFIWERATITTVWGRAELQFLNAAELNDGFDITAQPVYTQDTGIEAVYDREIAQMRIALPGAPISPQDLYVRYHGER